MPALPLGGFQIRIIREAIYHWDGGAFFGVVPKTLWSEKLPSDELNRVRVSFNCYLVETGDHTILIETGGTGKTNERAREHGDRLYSASAAGTHCGRRHRPRAYRHRSEHAPALGPLQ